VTIPWDSSPLFDTVPAEALDELARHAVSRHYEAGEAVCLAGDPGTSLYLVEAGLLHVLRPVDNALLVRQRPGDVLGEAASLTGEPRSATVLARVPSDVVELPRDDFLAVPSGTRYCSRTSPGWSAGGWSRAPLAAARAFAARLPQ
jgi:CRP/FNR family cyclic AMP-dependent transcriptional regulator